MPFALRRRATLPDAVGPGRHREGARRGRSGGRVAERHLTLAEASPDGVRARLGAALADRMPLWLQGARVTPGRRTVLGVLLVASAVAGVLGLRLAIASAAAHPVPAVAAGAVGAAGSAGAAPAPSGTATSTAVPSDLRSDLPTATPGATASPGADATTAILLVHVAGRVHHPGVVRLASGSRVLDAIKAAGGALPGSDLTTIDLAAPLVDGEQVLVARAVRGAVAGTSGTSIGGSAGSSGPVGAAGGTGVAVVDLNSADTTTLDSLPGVGPVLAQRILDWRTAHGRFSSVDELDEVSGIGDKLMSEIKPHVRV